MALRETNPRRYSQAKALNICVILLKQGGKAPATARLSLQVFIVLITIIETQTASIFVKQRLHEKPNLCWYS